MIGGFMKPKYKNLIKKASALTVVISLATAGMLSGIYLISAHAEESEQYESTSTIASGEDISIDEAHFPDECFRGWLKYEDKNNDGILSWEERQNVTSLQVNQSAIVSLKGIEYFPNLELLNCANNQINEMDLSGNPLLVALLCYNNMLTELDVSKNPKLEMLSCMGNDVKELDVSHNPSLTFLSCMYTNISELNLENNPALESLFCTGNQISELNLEANTSLVEVDVSGNHLDSLHLNTVNLKKFRGEEEKGKFDFVVSRAVMPLPDLVKIVRKNISTRQRNAMLNGVICLKGGNLQAELQPFGKKVEVVPISSMFQEEWFKEKNVVYLPL